MYINYFILEAGYAGFCWYAALWFYPLKLADVKKVLHNHTKIQTHNCVEIGRRRVIWGFGKAQLSLVEFVYYGAARGCSGTDYTSVPVWYTDTSTSAWKRCCKLLWRCTPNEFMTMDVLLWAWVRPVGQVQRGLRSHSQKLQRQHTRSRLQLPCRCN